MNTDLTETEKKGVRQRDHFEIEYTVGGVNFGAKISIRGPACTRERRLVPVHAAGGRTHTASDGGRRRRLSGTINTYAQTRRLT